MPDFGGGKIDDALDDDSDPAAALVAGGAADGSDSDGQPTEPERGRTDAAATEIGPDTHPSGSPLWAAALGTATTAAVVYGVDTLAGSALATLAGVLVAGVALVLVALELSLRGSYEEA